MHAVCLFPCQAITLTIWLLGLRNRRRLRFAHGKIECKAGACVFLESEAGALLLTLECNASGGFAFLGTCYFARAGPIFHKVFLAGRKVMAKLPLPGNLWDAKRALCLLNVFVEK